MEVEKAYNSWAQQYDTNENKTRDLEATVLRKTLNQLTFRSCLEIGCGTGKNTAYLIEKADEILAVDFSEEMLAKAKSKIVSNKVQFQQADITKAWTFINKQFDLVTFSLVLEHIENLDHVFVQAARALVEGGHVYIGELHPYKQYAGSKARFETEEGLQIVQCFTHNISEFTQTAKRHGFGLVDLDEYFDEDDRAQVPRIIALLFRKQKSSVSRSSRHPHS